METPKIFEDLFISCPNGGGLFFLHNGNIFRLDSFNTTGLFCYPFGVIRGLQPADICIYKETANFIKGENFRFGDVHDVHYNDGFIYIVGTSGNEVLKLTETGDEVQRWVFPGEKDSCHINCLATWNGRIVFSAFGDFRTHRGYKGNTDRAGFVQDLLTGERIISNLSQPHSPTPFGSNLLIANSEKMEICEYSKEGQLLRSKTLDGYTRGIFVGKNVIYVGLSRSRNIKFDEINSAAIVCLDSRTLEEITRLDIPTQEIYGIQAISNKDEIIHRISAIASHASTTLTNSLNECNEKVTSLNQEIIEKSEQIASQNQVLVERSTDIAQLQQVVVKQDGQIANIHATSLEREGLITSAQQKVHDRDELISNLRQVAREQNENIASLHRALIERDEQIANFEAESNRKVNQKDNATRDAQRQLNQVLNSRTWRATEPVRKIIEAVKQGVHSPRISSLEKAAKRARIRLDISLGTAISEIRDSSLFDSDYYLTTNPDLQAADLDPVKHYMLHGWREHRDPSAIFSTSQYLFDNPDIAKAEINPLLHFLRYGRLEGRKVRQPEMTREIALNSAPTQSDLPPHESQVGFKNLPVSLDYDLVRFSDCSIALTPSKEIDAAIYTEVEAIKKSGLFNEKFYRSTYLDLALHPVDAVRHYCQHGWREGRNPSAHFNTRFYLEKYSDIFDAGINPLFHYVIAGASELRLTNFESDIIKSGKNIISDATIDAEVDAIRSSKLFDESFYRAMYPDISHETYDTIRHYCQYGWHEGKDPSNDFDTKSYLAAYSDIRNAGINPFWHYVVAGAAELRHAAPDSATRFEVDIRFGNIETDIKLLSFYSAPNWEELRNGRPVSKGQSQPVLPVEELGFYDPTDWKTLSLQAKMAKQHGLYGFCFSVDAKAFTTEFQSPLISFLNKKDIDFNFCIHIKYNSENFSEKLIALLAKTIADSRYIHIQERPIILATFLDDSQRSASALAHLKSKIIEKYNVNLFIIGEYAPTYIDDSENFLTNIYDAVVDLPRNPIPRELGDFLPLDKNGSDVAPYAVVASQGIARIQKTESVEFPLYHCVTLGRDNTAKKPERPLVYTRFHIRDYRRWLDAAIRESRDNKPENQRLVFINGWSNWAEGLPLEPDRQGGFGRLNETTRAILNVATGTNMPKVSVIVPNYNHGIFLNRRLDSIYGQTYKNIEVILLDDCSSDNSRDILDKYSENFPEITRKLYNDRNSGSAFRQWSKGIKAATGDLVWIAESDDFCEVNFLEVLVRSFDDETVMLAYAKCIFIDRDENPMQDEFKIHLSDLECAEKWNSSYVESAHNEVNNALGIKNTIPNASGVLFKRPIDMPLLDNESWLSMVVAGDWIFYLQIIRGGKIAYSTNTTNFFRRYEGSTAELTYKKETFYREVGIASQTVATLYNVSIEVLEKCKKSFQNLYIYHFGENDKNFIIWYDYGAVLKAQKNRLPNVMVSTMGFYPGGAEILPIRLANEFKRQGLSVILLSAGLNPREDGVRRMLRNDVPLIETSDVEDVRKIIHDYGIEVLNTHQWHIQKYPQQVPDVFDDLRAHVASLHGMIEHGDAFGVTKEQLETADQSVTTWVYTAEKNLVPFSNFGLYEKSSPRFIKMPNGMQSPSILPVPRADMGIPEDAFTLCCVSRAIPDKGWAEMILVVERARTISGRDIRLVLVGNGPVYDEYCRGGVPQFVFLAGFSENSVGHYASADMGIMLTKFKSESFPLTIVDCLFAGKPYIASDVGDIKNMLTASDGIAGEVIGLNDWEIPIEKAAQLVADFATNEYRYVKSLEMVKDVVNRYKIDVVASQYIALFKSSRHEDRLRYRRSNS